MKKLLPIFLILVSTLSFAGGGWPQPKNSGFFKFGQWWLIADQHFTDVGLIDPNVTSGLYTSFFYGEYGITDKLTAILYAPIFTRATINNVYSLTTGNLITEGDAINSIGDFDVSLKYGLITNKRIVMSATAMFGLPFGNPEGGRDKNLQTGDGEFNQMIRLDASAGGNLGSIPIYGSAYVGLNNRTNGFSDELRFGVEAGVSFFDQKLYVIVRMNGVKSLLNGDTSMPISTTVFANNSEYLSFQPEVLYNFNKKFGISVSQGTAFYGKLIFARPTYSAGVHYILN